MTDDSSGSGQLSLHVPAGAEVIIATHLMELRRDLGLPDEVSHLIINPRTDLFGKWAPENKARLVSVHDASDRLVGGPEGSLDELFHEKPESSPETLLQFRRVYMHERPDTFAALAAFDDMLEPFAPPELLEPLRVLREGEEPYGMFDWISVVSGTRYISPALWPDDPSAQSALLGSELDACIGVLNDFLISLSLARNDTTIGPITRGDLPSMCPVILETLTPGMARNGVAYLYGIHENHSFPRRAPRDFAEIDEEELLAIQIARSNFYGGQPYFLFYELMQEAIRHFNEVRYSTSAVHTGTAVEVFFSTTIREALTARGTSVEQIARILEIPLRNRIADHFGRLVGVTVDLEDTSNPYGRWWQGGYRLRNEVVHSGRRATRDDAHAALDDANALITATRHGLAGDPQTAELASRVGWGPEPSPA